MLGATSASEYTFANSRAAAKLLVFLMALWTSKSLGIAIKSKSVRNDQ